MPHGGFRPGSGRKKAATVRYQESRRAQLEKLIGTEQWAEVIAALLKRMKQGHVPALAVLLPYILGAPPKPVEPPAEDKPSLVDDL